MDLGTVLSVAQTLFSALQCSELKEFCSLFGYKSQLDDLQRTVSAVRAVLRDAETKEELSHEAHIWVEELKDVVYDADDLLDEFVSLAEKNQLINSGKAAKNLRLLFSRYNPLGFARNMSEGVKKIRKKLDAITKNHAQFGFSVDYQPIRRRREETCSYVYEGNIIGREDDLETIVGHLLNDSIVQRDVSFLTIVGIGGLGKTALAQLVYNDPRVSTAFPLKMWACVSDHDQLHLDVEGILRKVLASATGKKHEETTKDCLQSQLRQILSTKYLLVLDDVWTENRNHWLKLVEFFLGGHGENWIVVTTRSHETARVVGGAPTHELQGLSMENSWCLFKKMAFGSEQSSPRDDFVKIGREIVERCARIPLAIRVAGSLLYGQDMSTWLSFQEIGLCNFKERQNDILPILKLSYHHLESPLKSCFTYCALFPKDAEMGKEMLKSLWIAQGYIVPLDDGQRMEDAAEEYFSILLRRCFIQDVKHDEYGDTYSCKIHDLMHDIARKVAGKEICFTNFVTNDVDKKVRHLAYSGNSASYAFNKSRIRSYLNVCKRHGCFKMDQSSLQALLANWMCLRVLSLSDSGIKSLPDSIGNLLHLRFLDLSDNGDLVVLPKSITKLFNLQALKLGQCHRLNELPKDLMKLVKMRILDISGCYSLTNMPKGMSKLTCLRILSMFPVDGSISLKQCFDQLGELKKLNSLKGELDVRIKLSQHARDVKDDGRRDGAYLKSKEHLNYIIISFYGGGNEEEEMRLLEELQPHPNLKGLKLSSEDDDMMIRMPGWVREKNLVTSLPNLVTLGLVNCNVDYLLHLGDLPHLKFLQLENLWNLEYIIEKSATVTSSSEPSASKLDGLSSVQGLFFFPCLEELVLNNLPRFKGWRNSVMGVGDYNQLNDTSRSMSPLLLPHLWSLKILNCRNLICNLLCPNLVVLRLQFFNKRLQIITHSKESGGEKEETSSTTSPSTSCSSHDRPKLSDVLIDDVAWLYSFPMQAFQCLALLKIQGDVEVKSLKEATEVFRSCSSSLRYLNIVDCPSLQSVLSEELAYLTALETLVISNCPNLSLSSGVEKREDGFGMPCPSLLYLLFASLPKLVDLPDWIQFLAALKTLRIMFCPEMESIPDWMTKLTSLDNLELLYCSARLKERCQRSTGLDWRHIQHIPYINIKPVTGPCKPLILFCEAGSSIRIRLI